MNCKNCGSDVERTFCSNCGQKTNVERITRSTLLTELSETVFQIDRGFFYTMQALSLRPGQSIRDYLEGRRKKYFKPIAYVLVFSTIYFLLSKFVNQATWLNDAITGYINGASDAKQDFQLPKVISWFIEHFAYFTLFLIPIFALASFISFRKYKLNYFEHIVIACYISGHQAIIYLVYMLLLVLTGFEIFEMLHVITSIAYLGWAYLQLFNKQNNVAVVFRLILTYGLFFIFGTIVLSALISL